MEEENVVRLNEATLSCLASFGWPVAILLIAHLFRRQIAEVIQNVSSVKYPGGEFTVQRPDPEATKPIKDTAPQEKFIDPRGFYTKVGLHKLIGDSDLVKRNEIVVDTLLIFRTSEQHTWLIATNRQLFCVLDDESTRASGLLIQWRIPLDDVEPIRARLSDRGNPVVDIDGRSGWLYSTSLHRSPDDLVSKIRNLIHQGKQGM